MTDEIAIDIRSLSKKYKLYDSPSDRLLETFHPFGKKRHEEVWAIRDLSLAVRKGESVGIIGVNGSGKSTLLQMICGVLAPTEGTCVVNGRITALLELGAGFSMESTGRENIFLQGAIMGLDHGETKAIFPAIESYADIGGFIDRAVKTYSTGMLVRLAIAIAFQMRPGILVVDEALAVGDIFFQAKCINTLQEMRRSGVTLLFVSHDMGTVRTLCDRGILLDEGRLICNGEPAQTIETYHGLRARQLGAVDLTQPEPEPETSPCAEETPESPSENPVPHADDQNVD